MTGFIGRVLEHAERMPDAVCVHVISRRWPLRTYTWGKLASAAARAAAMLSNSGVTRGRVVVLIGTHHPDLYAVWLGAVWVGAIPSIFAEPSVRMAKEIYWARLSSLLAIVEPALIACDPGVKARLGSVGTGLVSYEEIASSAPVPRPLECGDADLLLLQHSSGTTGLQKGVMLSHGAVLRHAEAYARSIEMTKSDVVATWLPLYHDMGLIACFINPLLTGASVIWMSPFEWVASPGILLSAISDYRATLTWLPNFAFAFMAARVPDPPSAFDLSSLRAVINCSEPVTATSMDAFAERFERYGLPPNALQTCYAMAENVFAVTTSTSSRPARRMRIARGTWAAEHRAVEHRAADDDTLELVSSGHPIGGCEVEIVSEEGTELVASEAGRILIRSQFLFDGYFQRDQLNAGILDGQGFFDTGDIGFLDDRGELFVTGRRKDLIIVGGKNVYPQDVEQVVGELDGVHPGRVVCFGVPARNLGTEALVVIVEADTLSDDVEPLAALIRKTVPARLDLDVTDVRVVQRGLLRKSSSGKLAREGNREWYLAGRFGELPSNIEMGE